VTARVKILELPERAQQLIGDGTITLAAVDQLRAIGTIAPALLDAVIAYRNDGTARLPREELEISELHVELGTLSPAERRDLANALLRAAWSATLEETRILLLDLLVQTDDAALDEVA
jgi:hypothetical protein